MKPPKAQKALTKPKLSYIMFVFKSFLLLRLRKKVQGMYKFWISVIAVGALLVGASTVGRTIETNADLRAELEQIRDQYKVALDALAAQGEENRQLYCEMEELRAEVTPQATASPVESSEVAELQSSANPMLVPPPQPMPQKDPCFGTYFWGEGSPENSSDSASEQPM